MDAAKRDNVPAPKIAAQKDLSKKGERRKARSEKKSDRKEARTDRKNSRKKSRQVGREQRKDRRKNKPGLFAGGGIFYNTLSD